MGIPIPKVDSFSYLSERRYLAAMTMAEIAAARVRAVAMAAANAMATAVVMATAMEMATATTMAALREIALAMQQRQWRQQQRLTQ